MSEKPDFSKQAQVFSALSSELRLQLLQEIVEGPVTAPGLAENEDYEVTAETIHNNLKKLRQVGLLESEVVYGPGNRPKDSFSLSKGGFKLLLEVTGEYRFELSHSE